MKVTDRLEKPFGLMVLERDEEGRKLLRKAIAAVVHGRSAKIYHNGFEVTVREAPMRLSRQFALKPSI